MRGHGLRAAVAILIAGAGLGLTARASSAEGAERQRAWWTHTREALFAGLTLSPEQARRVDRLIEAQLDSRARLQQLDGELAAARKADDAERSAALRAQRPALRARIKDPQDLFDEMRALLAEGQRPTFDMNRARVAAESQRPRQAPQGDAQRAGTDVKGTDD